MAKYYNQKDITCMKADKVEPPYMTFSEKEFVDVCHTFKGNASVVLVWQYLMKNKNGYCLEFSSKACSNFTALSENTIRKAIKELEDKCYLVNVVENQYLCFTAPLGNVEEVVEYYYPQFVQKCTLYQDLVVPPSESGTPSTKNWEIPPSESGTQTSKTSRKSTSTSTDGSQSSPEQEKSREEKSSTKKSKVKTLEDLTLEELQSALGDFNNHDDYEVIKKRYGLAKNSLPNAKSLFQNKVPKMIEALKQESYKNAQEQLDKLRSLSQGDVNYAIDFCGITDELLNSVSEYDSSNWYKGDELRTYLRDRFGLSITFMEDNLSFSWVLYDYAKTGDKDKFLEFTEYWTTL